MRLTIKKAVEGTLEKWRWFAETGTHPGDERLWPGLEINGGKWPVYEEECYLCIYSTNKAKKEKVFNDCQFCPYDKLFGFCANQNTHFDNWMYAKTIEQRQKFAKEIVSQLEIIQEELKSLELKV